MLSALVAISRKISEAYQNFAASLWSPPWIACSASFPSSGLPITGLWRSAWKRWFETLARRKRLDYHYHRQLQSVPRWSLPWRWWGWRRQGQRTRGKGTLRHRIQAKGRSSVCTGYGCLGPRRVGIDSSFRRSGCQLVPGSELACWEQIQPFRRPSRAWAESTDLEGLRTVLMSLELQPGKPKRSLLCLTYLDMCLCSTRVRAVPQQQPGNRYHTALCLCLYSWSSPCIYRGIWRQP